MNRRSTIRQELGGEFGMMNAALEATNKAMSKESRDEYDTS